ncbi:MAG: autotransporter domain-containing protein [Alphaproteobacteria bacterium]|nr:autotransporter domain-containing protein [Alphaproteobacteria bacterium]
MGRSVDFPRGYIEAISKLCKTVPSETRKANLLSRWSPPILALAAILAWTAPAFAQQAAIGAGVTALNALGITDGVSMTAGAGTGTLTVGNENVFTNNNGGDYTNPAIVSDANATHIVTFNGTSNVYGRVGAAAGPIFLNINAGANGSTVNFLGGVYTTNFFVTGTGTVNFQSAGTNTSPGGITFQADGTIGLDPNTSLTGAITTNTNNTGTLILGSGSTLTGAVGAGAAALKNITVTGGSNTAGVLGTITGAVNAYTFTLGTNTLNVTGALTLADSTTNGVINTTLASSTVYGNIRPTGATNLGASLTINVTVPTSATFPVGTIFNVVQTRSGTAQSGTDGSVVTVTVVGGTNPLYTFEPIPAAGTAIGLVAFKVTGTPLTASVTPPAGVVLPATQPIAAAAATALDEATPTADILTVQAAINAMTDASAIVDAEAQLAPSAPAVATPLLTFKASQQFQNLWLSRLDEIMCNQVSQKLSDEQKALCAQNANKSGWWVKGFGVFASQEESKTFVGYNSRILGTMLAYDMPLNKYTRVGLGAGYAQTEIEGDRYDARVDFNTYQGTAYIAYEPASFFVDASASFGWSDYKGERHIAFPGVNRVAESEYSGQNYTGFVTSGYHFFGPRGFTMTPLASLQYTHMDISGYKETGAGDVSLDVKHQRYNFLESGLGAKLARPIAVGNKAFVPEIHGRWYYEILNPSLKSEAEYTGGSPKFSTPGFSPERNLYNVGGGLTLLSCACTDKVWSLEAVYDYEWAASNYSAHEGMLRYSGRF